MVKLQFNASNKRDTGGDFPALKLTHGEKARILCIETEPEVGFIHTLRAPAILADGTPVMEQAKSRGGEMVDRQKMDYMGRHLCFGQIETLLETGKDPANCPTCQASVEHADMIDAPARRFAMHVVKYKVVPGSYKVQNPFQAELLVWSFTDKKFGTISDIAEEHGDLRSKDLMLGPCENADFQNFEIQVAGSAAWLENEENKKFVTTLYAANKIPDLTVAIGRKIEKSMAIEDIQKVLTRYATARGASMVSNAAPSAAAGMGGGASSGTDLDALLSGAAPAPAADFTIPGAPSTPPDFVTEALEPPAASSAPSAPEVPVEAPAAPAAAEPQAEQPKVLNFDELLNGL
jgi:hypothetical protein